MVAVEPDAGMRRLLALGCPESEAMDGRAEQIPLAADSVDAVFVAPKPSIGSTTKQP